jgi:hypothetical protein
MWHRTSDSTHRPLRGISGFYTRTQQKIAQFRLSPFPPKPPELCGRRHCYGDRNYSAVDTAHDPRELELALKINF